jgi:hypothetical protein
MLQLPVLHGWAFGISKQWYEQRTTVLIPAAAFPKDNKTWYLHSARMQLAA